MGGRTSRLTPEQRDELRAKVNAAAPPSYRPALHLLIPMTIGAAMIAAALLTLRRFEPWQLAIVPLALVVLNAGEWRVHRDLLHKRTWPLEFLYDRHTPEHHMIFVTEDMALRSSREFRLVLIPAWGVVVSFVSALPIPAVLAAFGQWNMGVFWLVTTMLYVLSYEWLHLSFHLPTDTFLGRRKLIAILRRHHAIHHDPTLMQKWNFNVVVPLWDVVRGTVWREKNGNANASANENANANANG
jgi:hypothetical protein